MGKIKELSRKILFKGFAGIEQYVFELPENHQEVSRVVITRPEAAAILLINKTAQKVVLIRQFRAPVYHNNGDGFVYEVAAGIIEKGENPIDSIIRETFEETGYHIANPILISSFYPTVGLLNEIIHLYYAVVETSDKTGNGGGLENENEFLDVTEFSFDEVFSLLDKGEIIDAKTIIALLWLKNKVESL